MRVERLNGYISLYRDLGLEEEDSNYHSGDCDEYDDEVLSHDEVREEGSHLYSLRLRHMSFTLN